MQPNQKLGIASDIYSLAAILYVLVTGQLPISANLRSKQNVPLPAPKQLNPMLSDRFNDAILEGLELNLKQRPQYLKDWLDLFKTKKTTKKEPQQLLSLDDIPTTLNESLSKNIPILDAIVTDDGTIVQQVGKISLLPKGNFLSNI